MGSGLLWWLRPDGKTQVTIEYLQRADGSVEPQKIHTVVISTQHAEPLSGHPLQGGRRLHRPRCYRAQHGGDEQTDCGGGREEDFGRNHLEEWQASSDLVR